MANINWGPVINQTNLLEGCTVLVCENHGGLIISKKTLSECHYFEKLHSVDMTQFKVDDETYAFEQDCNSSVLLPLLPREILMTHYDHCETIQGYHEFKHSCFEILKNFHPNIFLTITA